MTESVTSLIGNTPLVRVQTDAAESKIYLKLEARNPGGSSKDRVAMAMIAAACRDGLIKPETVIIEATSGNTGIGLAMAAAARGLNLVLAMPASMSTERRKLLQAYGAQLILTGGAEGMAGAINTVHKMLAADSRYLHLDQFSNTANPRIHFATTGPEIFRDLEGKVDAFVAGVGTGGTITGAGGFLKAVRPAVKVYAVEPAESSVLGGGQPGPHSIQGIGAGFIPAVLDTSLIDEVIPVASDAAMATARNLASAQGLLVGVSSGAAVWAAREVARRLGPGKTVVTIAPDSGERYLSTPLFQEENQS